MPLPPYDADRIETINELASMPGYDPGYELAYYNEWNDFEGSSWFAVFERDGEYFTCQGGYSPEAGDVDDRLEYSPVSLAEALEGIEEMEAACAAMVRKHAGKRAPAP